MNKPVLKLTSIEALRRYFRFRGMRGWPAENWSRVGKVETFQGGYTGEYGYWWWSDAPYRVFTLDEHFRLNALQDVVRRMLGKKVLIASDFVTVWGRWLSERGGSTGLRVQALDIIRESGATETFCGAFLLHNASPAALAEFAASFCWVEGGSGPDILVVPVGREIVLRLQGGGIAWCFSRDSETLSAFGDIVNAHGETHELTAYEVTNSAIDGETEHPVAWLFDGEWHIFSQVGNVGVTHETLEQEEIILRHEAEGLLLGFGADDAAGRHSVHLDVGQAAKISDALLKASTLARTGETEALNVVIRCTADKSGERSEVSIGVTRNEVEIGIGTSQDRHSTLLWPADAEQLASAILEAAGQ